MESDSILFFITIRQLSHLSIVKPLGDLTSELMCCCETFCKITFGGRLTNVIPLLLLLPKLFSDLLSRSELNAV